MCQLFAVNSKNPVRINDYLTRFYKNSAMHPHGWGLARFWGEEYSIEKESLQASKSNYLKEQLSQPITVESALAHIRYATIGNVDYKNSHPYKKRDNSSRRWVMIHNGTIFDYPKLAKYTKLQKGETDSERILLYLVDRINASQKNSDRALSFEERFALLDEIIADMSKGNKLNLIIYDGNYMYVHTNYANSLYSLEKDGAVFFSTEPLTDEEWKPVKFTTLLAYKNGRLAAEGTTHNNEYEDNEEALRMLYRIFADL